MNDATDIWRIDMEKRSDGARVFRDLAPTVLQLNTYIHIFLNIFLKTEYVLSVHVLFLDVYLFSDVQ